VLGFTNVQMFAIDIVHLINPRFLATASQKRLRVKSGFVGFFRRRVCRGRIAQG
jgi:hypothetical protein